MELQEGTIIYTDQITKSELISFVIKKCNEIYQEVGSGHLESVYHRCLEHELKLNNIPYESEIVLPIYYKNHYVGFGRADIVLYRNDPNRSIVIELKAQTGNFCYKDIHKAKFYMNSLNLDTGIMVNFPHFQTKECKFKLL